MQSYIGHNNENGACNHEEEENAAIDLLEPSVGWIFPKAKVSFVHASHLNVTNKCCVAHFLNVMLNSSLHGIQKMKSR